MILFTNELEIIKQQANQIIIEEDQDRFYVIGLSKKDKNTISKREYSKAEEKCVIENIILYFMIRNKINTIQKLGDSQVYSSLNGKSLTLIHLSNYFQNVLQALELNYQETVKKSMQFVPFVNYFEFHTLEQYSSFQIQNKTDCILYVTNKDLQYLDEILEKVVCGMESIEIFKEENSCYFLIGSVKIRFSNALYDYIIAKLSSFCDKIKIVEERDYENNYGRHRKLL